MRRRGWSRSGLAAGGVVLALAAAAVTTAGGARAAPPVPAVSLPVPSLPTLPVPTPPLPSLPLPSLPSLPVPTPLPVVTAPPGPLGTPAGGTEGPGNSGVSGPAAASGSAGSSVPAVQASSFDGLLGLLGTPANVGVEQPSLEHFDLQATLASGRVVPLPAGGGSRSPAPALVAGLVLGCLLVVVGVGVSRQHRRRLSVMRVAVAGPLLVVAAVVTVGAAQTTWFPATRTAAPAPVAVAGARSHSPAAAATPATAGVSLFNRLVGFEAERAQTQAALQSPAAVLGGGQLRTVHRLAIALEGVLQQEYAFFAATAANPAQAAALVQAAAAQPSPTRNAVDYDVQAVEAQLAQQAAIAQTARNDTAAVPSLPAGAATPAGGSARYSWPMSGVVTQGFGPSQILIEPAVTLSGVTYPHFHTGVDIATAPGTPVQAAADGVVALAGSEVDPAGHLVGYGNYVVVAHSDGIITLYGHLEQLLVRAGQAVRASDLVGLEGSTGNSTGPHLHFELRVRGVPTDPASYIQPR